MTVDIRGKAGFLLKTAQVSTNDPANPIVVLRLKVTVKPSV